MPSLADEDDNLFERTGATNIADSPRCPVEMGLWDDDDDLVCTRPIHSAPAGIDEIPVCLMHSKDRGKQAGPLFEEFWRVFEEILENAQEGEARFDNFVFPELDLNGRTIRAMCWFIGATFEQDANFAEVTFLQNVDFLDATFMQYANFIETTFAQSANFSGATFIQFAAFAHATFTQRAVFVSANFIEIALFNDALFCQDSEFFDSTFGGNAQFVSVVFTRDAQFARVKFARDAEFGTTVFTTKTDFVDATFMCNAGFSGATFTQSADFQNTTFYGTAIWRTTSFLKNAIFRRTKFEPAVEGEPSAVFALTNFFEPNEIVFEHVDLSRVLFHNCDVSEIRFTSSVQWGKRRGRKAMIFEETIPLDHEDAKELQRNRRRDYRAVAQVYQQLKKNYDARLDYWTANEFHFGEMEMQRLAIRTEGRPAWLRKFRSIWRPHFSLIAWYKRTSDYGNSFGKPIVWLASILILFAFLLPFAGLQHSPPNPYVETYASVRNAKECIDRHCYTALLGKGLIVSVETAALQKGTEFSPAYPWGRVLAMIELLLTSTLVAIILIAIRRQFRR